jgi:hypothetical protein
MGNMIRWLKRDVFPVQMITILFIHLFIKPISAVKRYFCSIPASGSKSALRNQLLFQSITKCGNT